MKVLILAAGYGTRLYPLTKELPKPLIKIKDKPIINFLIEKIYQLKNYFCIDQIRIVSNNKFYQNFLNWKVKYKIEAEILNDGTNSPQERLGAIKDIRFGIGNSIEEDWLVLGGDNLFDDPLIDFLNSSQKNKPYATVGIYKLDNISEASKFGVVKINSCNCIVDFEEKPKNPKSDLVASCIYFFPKETIKFLDIFISQEVGVDASGKYISWLSKKDKVFAHILRGRWLDIGHFDSLKKAEEEFSCSFYEVREVKRKS